MVELGEVKEESKQDRYPILRHIVILGGGYIVSKVHNYIINLLKPAYHLHLIQCPQLILHSESGPEVLWRR